MWKERALLVSMQSFMPAWAWMSSMIVLFAPMHWLLLKLAPAVSPGQAQEPLAQAAGTAPG